MRQFLEQLVTRLPFYYPLKNTLIRRRQKQELVRWEQNGRPLPPPHLVKQNTLRTIAQQYGLKVLVETGTYLGDMVEAMKTVFDRIYSIELSTYLYQKARQRFRRQPKITILQGDSATELKHVVEHLDEPALFWLDGHYSAGVTAKGRKDTPVLEELGHILNSRQDKHIILIDDAHLFGADPAYPSVDEVSRYVKARRPDACIAVRDNMIIVTLKP